MKKTAKRLLCKYRCLLFVTQVIKALNALIIRLCAVLKGFRRYWCYCMGYAFLEIVRHSFRDNFWSKLIDLGNVWELFGNCLGNVLLKINQLDAKYGKCLGIVWELFGNCLGLSKKKIISKQKKKRGMFCITKILLYL